MLQDERAAVNYNTFESKPWEQSKKDNKKAKALQDAVDAKMQEFNAHKNKIPPPEVKHENEKQFKADINVFGVNLLAGGKTLLSMANLRLVQGRKYGLIGRNGIGKTTLINAISRGEIDKFPKNIHILQVE
jgi:ABC-type molybdenum transport system ATPase subunit/photorepair protein PhrA